VLPDHALIQQATICEKLKGPDDWDLHYIQRFLESDDCVNDVLVGNDHMVWGADDDREAHSPELVVLRQRQYTDAFSHWLGEKAMRRLGVLGLQRFMKIDKTYGTPCWKDHDTFKVTFGITGAIAALMPVISILVLLKANSTEARLGKIAVFNVLLVGCLAFFTEAKRKDVFAMIAA
jgi:hypothetical protein